jgi:hypothetical protein
METSGPWKINQYGVMNVPQRDSRGWFAINGATTAAMIESLRAVGPIEKLSITNGPLITVRAAKLLCSLSRVERLWLWCDVTRAAVSHLIRLPGLTTLDVLAIHKPGELRGFEFASSLRTLRANHYLEEDDLLAIASAPHLSELGAQGANLTSAAFDALMAMPELNALDLEGTSFDDEMARKIGQSTSIHTLDIGATKLTGRGLKYLCSMKQLRSLDLWATSVREPDLDLLRSLPQLEYVSVGGYAGDESLDSGHLVPLFQSLPSLKRLWLDGVNISEAQVAELKKTLSSVRVTNLGSHDA